MKILVYFNSMAPAGGIERVISSHIKFMAANHEVILVTHDRKPSFYELPPNVKHESIDIDLELNMASRFVRMKQIATSFISIIKKIRQKKRQFQPDIIYVPSPLTTLLSYIAFRGGRKILVTEHSSFSAYNSFYKKVASFLYRKVGLLTVPTTMDSEFYKSVGVNNEYLPNPLPFNPEQQSSLENKTVLHVGRFTDDKRHLELLKIWSLSNAKDNGWKLKLIGKGENDALIRAKITELRLEESAVITPPTKNIISEYLASSVFALTSRAEGFGLVLAEAMSCGVPCISYKVPSGPRDIIEDGVNGFLVENNNAEVFAEKINELCRDFELRQQMGKNAKNSVQKFSEEEVSSKLNELIDKNF
ncbi:glycosyltransferase family 4 protein [Chryseobacterium taklimakanense]|uniref:glycosyltransferase family 4 protein n=1 Tax=Chryseobacterium taklimakanense TaxID=536441 RepID=UPI000F5EDE3B|nr:glycosyltransferase family 4 protein [Chryseobacterium taklimakanense]AZI23393.1 glycosyltransferase family 4 protein [Chryseobacterium taklimakanense]